ncbi:MAG: hypothetical protein EAZ95_19920 [Bacteroidetes bacterium]|nr:MAG: hypothetical protein EAZ95_19920 [Bacteroidota bacterium]
MKPFEKWKTEEVERTFGIAQKDSCPLMETWLAYQTPLTPAELARAEDLRKRHKDFVDFWAEEDIKVFFLMPIIDIVYFYELNKYRTFMEATVEANLTDVRNETQKVRGRVEMLVATGKQDPQTPFFFLNEYKPQIKAQADPKGQLLIAMLAAQTLNNGKNLPIYGLYTIGQNWYFVLLEGKYYYISKQFDATEMEDLTIVLYMLKFVKAHIEQNI